MVQNPSLVNEYIIDQKSGINCLHILQLGWGPPLAHHFWKTSVEQNPGKNGKVQTEMGRHKQWEV
jgi:hypothetical protein